MDSEDLVLGVRVMRGWENRKRGGNRRDILSSQLRGLRLFVYACEITNLNF
jgi:hypothetical protein